MISLVNITHHYGVRPVLRGVSLDIAGGEVLAIMGPNGTGKSTMLALMAGVLWPIKGQVEIDGKRRRADPETELAIRRKVVYLPAETWLPLTRTGREFLLAVGRLYQIDEERLMDHAERLFSLFHLEQQADMPIRGYSTGQKRKLAIAGVLATEAPIILLDEPFSGGLDPSGILALRRVMQHMAERDDVTIVMATPVPELVEGLADRVAILNEGRIVACDTPKGLRQQTGCEGPLEEVLEKLINPRTLGNIEHYLQREGT